MKSNFHNKDFQKIESYLNYAAIPEKGILLGKNGSISTLVKLGGLDLESSSMMDAAAKMETLNSSINLMPPGYMLQFDYHRKKSTSYDLVNPFKNIALKEIEEERRHLFSNSDFHFSSDLNLWFTQLPPDRVMPSETKLNLRLGEFTKLREETEQWLSVLSPKKKNNLTDLLQILNSTMSNNYPSINVGDIPVFLDHQLTAGDFRLHADYISINNLYVACISLYGFSDTHTYPLMIDELSKQGFEYRWNTRFMPMSKENGIDILKGQRKKWSQQVYSFVDQLFNNPNPRINKTALNKSNEVEEAIEQIRSDETSYGYYSSTIILSEENLDNLKKNIAQAIKSIRSCGIVPKVETYNLLDTWLGSLPSHSMYNLRRPLINTRNLLHLLPLNIPTKGLLFNQNPLFPKNSPPISKMFTPDGQSFNFHIHENDVGHTLILGPTGTGKSYFLGLLMAQFLRFERSKVFCFDKDYSSYMLAKASGQHFDILNNKEINLSPLSRLENQSDIEWATSWVKNILSLNNLSLGISDSKEIKDAILLLSKSSNRSLSNLYHLLVDPAHKEALSDYLESGPLGSLLDNRSEKNEYSCDLTVFEISHLIKLNQGNGRLFLPTLEAMLRTIELSITGDPVLICIDEAWLAFKNPVFREKIEEWLTTLRKFNASVVLTTTEVSSFIKSPIASTILSACRTKIFLANPNATSKIFKEDYLSCGLSVSQINLISRLISKRQYLYTSGDLSRVFETGSGPIQLKILSHLNESERKEIDQLEFKYPNDWLERWLTSES